jgi:hypothetical protein
VLLGLALAPAAAAQSFEVSAHVAASQWSEFEGTDAGVGGRVAWRAVPLVGLEADVTWYPSGFPDEQAFSGRRVEGLFGVSVGPTMGRLRPFARLAAGFLQSSEAPAPFPCILIFPPPINCLMASGHTLPAADIGGGVTVDLGARTFLRIDAGARLLRYPGPAFRFEPREIKDGEYWGGALRIAVGGGVRF